MSTLRDDLIKLGKAQPSLRAHLGPILKAHDRSAAYKGVPYGGVSKDEVLGLLTDANLIGDEYVVKFAQSLYTRMTTSRSFIPNAGFLPTPKQRDLAKKTIALYAKLKSSGDFGVLEDLAALEVKARDFKSQALIQQVKTQILTGKWPSATQLDLLEKVYAFYNVTNYRLASKVQGAAAFPHDGIAPNMIPKWVTTPTPMEAWDGRHRVTVPEGTQVLFVGRDRFVGVAADKYLDNYLGVQAEFAEARKRKMDPLSKEWREIWSEEWARGLHRSASSKTAMGGDILEGYRRNGRVIAPKADLRDANLRGEDLSGADLTGADLSGADLSDANLGIADLRKANLSHADLAGANLHGARLNGADLSHASLHKARLNAANFHGANLAGAWLAKAILLKATLAGANLRGAHLAGADLSRANLKGADLSGADLTRANLSGADLSGANLSGADLDLAILTGAKMDGPARSASRKTAMDPRKEAAMFMVAFYKDSAHYTITVEDGLADLKAMKFLQVAMVNATSDKAEDVRMEAKFGQPGNQLKHGPGRMMRNPPNMSLETAEWWRSQNDAVQFTLARQVITMQAKAGGYSVDPKMLIRGSQKTAMDHTSVRELHLYLENESALYRQKQAIEANQRKHWARGQWNLAGSVKGFMYLVDAASKMYSKEFGGPPFPKPERMEVARLLAVDFQDEMGLG